MSTGTQRRTRSQRVATVELPPGPFGVLLLRLQSGYVLFRLALCALAAVMLWAMTRGWSPPQPHHVDQIPLRAIVSRVPFEQIDEAATAKAQDDAAKNAVAIYDQDPAPLVQLKARILNDELSQMIKAPALDDVAPEMWQMYTAPLAEGTPPPTEEERQQQFQRFREALTAEGAFEKFTTAMNEVFAPLEQNGILDALPPEHDANFESIAVRLRGSTGFPTIVRVSEVLREHVVNQLQKALEAKAPSLDVATRVFARLNPDLRPTLQLNLPATREAQTEARNAVPTVKTLIPPGTILAPAGQPIGDSQLAQIELEHKTDLGSRGWLQKLARSAAVLGMYAALYTLCGFYISSREPRIINQLPRFLMLLAAVLATTALVLLTYGQQWRAELVPLLLFGMSVAIAYQQELALLLATAVTLIAVVALGHPLGFALILMATTAGAILALDSVRSRSKLLLVGFAAGLVAFLTTLGVGTLEGYPFWSTFWLGAKLALWSLIAGSLMTCLLPLVERLFNVQTDLSLNELGDPAHPLLQELVRRAPGTYNHSITVASLAEAAAESIGARGLLVRVGAYFHDIGKMLKPGYFAENQAKGDNRHESLLPAMSTLVIIAHVKDGADLARQNKLPEAMIDFIQQHHGTTLVEFFYRQATDRKNGDKSQPEVDETSFRYPGPKPQTKEAGVMMIADAVESASRALVEPTPARLESLVEGICRKRLLDGQFDECGLTLSEVSKIGDSLVKSLTAIYHGRVKYPGQETA
ncbi:MAG: HDIG domain-containing metalloprotein [Pirellulales bacterium]